MATIPSSPYPVKTILVDSPIANAFAAPGGTIVVFRGLLRKTGRAEELAGVMAHEIQHVLHRHPVAAVLRQVSLQALISLVAGNSSGMSSALQTAGTLGVLRYDRNDEEAADRDAVRMMQVARIDPTGLVSILEKLQQAQGNEPAGLEYLSTHPLTATRIQEIRRLAASPAVPRLPLLPEYSWAKIKKACQGG